MKRLTKNFQDFVNEKKSFRLNEAVGTERFLDILYRIGFPLVNDGAYEFDVDDNNTVTLRRLNRPNEQRFRQQISIYKALKMLNSVGNVDIDPFEEENWNYELSDREIERYGNAFKNANNEYWDDEGEEIDLY